MLSSPKATDKGSNNLPRAPTLLGAPGGTPYYIIREQNTSIEQSP